jgi:hypothetical protein
MGTSVVPDANDVLGFTAFIKRYKKGLAVEREAVKNIGLVR